MKSAKVELILFVMAFVAILVSILAFDTPISANAASFNDEQGESKFDRYPPRGKDPTPPENFPWESPAPVPYPDLHRRIPRPFWCGPWPSGCVPPFLN
jgi:hypothetical protein